MTEFHPGSANITGYLTKYHQNQKFIVYNISLLIPPNLSWNITKRFSEFLLFHRQLPKNLRNSLPKLPSKTLFHKNLNVIEQRKAMFQVYLNALLERENFMNEPLVKEFLCVPEGRFALDGAHAYHEALLDERDVNESNERVRRATTFHDARGAAETLQKRPVSMPVHAWKSATAQIATDVSLANRIQYCDVPCSMSKVVHTYRAAHESELNVTQEDFVLVYAQDDDWALARNEEKLGFIPMHVLQDEDALAVGPSTPTTAHLAAVRRRQSVINVGGPRGEWQYGRAAVVTDDVASPGTSSTVMSNLTSILYDYYPLQDDELQLSRGDLVRIVREENDRYKVTVVERDNVSQMEPKSGWIPCDYIEKPRLLRNATNG